MSIFDAARRFRDAFTYDPGHSDLDDEQPISISVTLGDWRKLDIALSERTEMLDAAVSPSAQVPASLQLPSGATQAGQFDKQETPRSNDEEDRCRECGLSFVPSQLARQLERELAEAHHDLESGFMQGAYARLKNLQEAERNLSARGDTERLDWLESQLKYGWGDGFVMQAMDSGGQYVRPWRKANEALYPPDPKSKAGVWQADIRTAIDEAMLAEKQTQYVNSLSENDK